MAVRERVVELREQLAAMRDARARTDQDNAERECWWWWWWWVGGGCVGASRDFSHLSVSLSTSVSLSLPLSLYPSTLGYSRLSNLPLQLVYLPPIYLPVIYFYLPPNLLLLLTSPSTDRPVTAAVATLRETVALQRHQLRLAKELAVELERRASASANVDANAHVKEPPSPPMAKEPSPPMAKEPPPPTLATGCQPSV